MSEIVSLLPDDLVVPAITHPAAAAALDIETIEDDELRMALLTRLPARSAAFAGP